MAPHYEITVQNDSGSPFTYTITQETSSIESLDGRPWPLVIYKARVPAGASATFEIEVPNPYYAYALSSQGNPGHGTGVQIISKVPIKLGTTKKEDGSKVPGSSVKYVVSGGAPSLQDTNTPDGWLGSFEVRTGDDFTDDDAKKGNYLLGYGSREKAWVAFTPQPSLQYQITPLEVFYLFYSNLQEGQIVDVKTVGPALKLDFKAMGKKDVSVTHDPEGKLVINK